VHVEVPS